MLPLQTLPLRRGHFRVLLTASADQCLGAALSTLVGVIIPMVQLVGRPELSAFGQGMVACTSLFGITVGSLLFGRLIDRFGCLLFFRFCPLLVCAASLYACFTGDLSDLVPALFLMGLGIGGGYSLDGEYISEIMPARRRLFMVGVAKASSALGNIGMAVGCFLLIRHMPSPEAWSRLLLLVSLLSGVMFLSRLPFAESPGWLLAHGRRKEAERAARYFLGEDVTAIPDNEVEPPLPAVSSLSSSFKGGRLKRAVFCGLPWACEGLGVYGIGVFLPVLMLALGLGHSDTTGGITGEAAGMVHIIRSVELSAWVNLAILPGFVIGLLLVNRYNPVRMQVGGFLLCAAGLALLYAAWHFRLPVWMALGGFVLFELFINAGPHLVTFILPSQIYPVRDRGKGAGQAAAVGKVGAVLGVLFIPLLLRWGGIGLVLLVCIVVQLLGGLVTWALGREVMKS